VSRSGGDRTKEEAQKLLVWRCKRYQVLEAWARFEQEGGLKKYDELGCSTEEPFNAAGIEKRLNQLQKAKKLRDQLSQLPAIVPSAAAPAPKKPAVPARPARPAVTGATVGKLGQEIRTRIVSGHFDRKMEDAFLQRLSSAVLLAKDPSGWTTASEQLRQLQDDVEAVTTG
jgi:hypothetical protein